MTKKLKFIYLRIELRVERIIRCGSAVLPVALVELIAAAEVELIGGAIGATGIIKPEFDTKDLTGLLLLATLLLALPVSLLNTSLVAPLSSIALLLLLPLLPVDFFACPNSVARHLEAKVSEHKVSLTLYTAGETFTHIKTFEFPPKESCSRNVNLELR